MAQKNLDFRRALADPRAEFGIPERLLADPRLDREGKRAILRSWEQNERELADAESEGMTRGERNMLQRVVKALDAISGTVETRPEITTPHANRSAGSETREDANRTARKAKDLMRPLDEVVHIDQDLSDAQVRMQRFQTSFLPVVDGDEIVGILTARDIYGEPPATTSDASAAKVRDRLSRDVAFCYEADELETVKAVIHESGQRRLLVADEDHQLVGLLTLERVAAALRDCGPRRPPVPRRRPDRRLTKTAGRAKGADPGTIGVYAVKPKIRT